MARREHRKDAAAIPRRMETSTLMHTHESTLGFMKSRCVRIKSNHDLMRVLATGLFGDSGAAPYHLEQDLNSSEEDVYDDDDDDDEEEEYDYFSPRPAPLCMTPPHPRIREVTDEEAEKHQREQMEEERRKERNKRKRMRKKEKKRQEKENVVKNISPEEEQDESDSEIQEEKTPIENKVEANKSSVTQNVTAQHKEGSIDNKENLVTIKKTEGKVGERGKSDASKTPKENPVIKNKEKNKSDSNKRENATKANVEKSSASGKKEFPVQFLRQTDEEFPVQFLRQTDEEFPVQFLLQTDKAKKKLNLDLSNAVKSVPEETRGQTPAKNKENNKLMEAPPLKVENPEVVGKSEDQKKKEVMKDEPDEEEKTLNSTAEEFAMKSRELAGTGNRLAASGMYDIAVKCFTDAIKFNPKEYRLFGNRSLCFERLQQYENALRDADLALCMEPHWIKGLFRKGKALCGLKRYYEAALVYKEVLRLESSSAEAAQELKRAQTLYLMENGFSWAQSNEALKAHASLEDAVESLHANQRKATPAVSGSGAGSGAEDTLEPKVRSDLSEVGGKSFLQINRRRAQQVRESEDLVQNRSKSQSPTPRSKNPLKPELFSVWVGSLVSSVTYSKLHELFSRVGAIYSIKMLLEQQCAFVNYPSKEECDRAIHSFNGMVWEGAPLSVRYPLKGQSGMGSYKKECFFWRTTGCTRSDCNYKHVAENKGVDRDKFTSRLGQFQ